MPNFEVLENFEVWSRRKMSRTSESYPAALELKVMIVNMPALLGGEEE